MARTKTEALWLLSFLYATLQESDSNPLRANKAYFSHLGAILEGASEDILTITLGTMLRPCPGVCRWLNRQKYSGDTHATTLGGVKRKERDSPGLCCRRQAENHWWEFLEADFSFPAITGAPLAGTVSHQHELLRQGGFKERVNGHLSGRVSRKEDEDKVKGSPPEFGDCVIPCVCIHMYNKKCAHMYTQTYI